MQVYEMTGGIAVGDEVEFTGEMLSVELGPGLLTQVFDGLQNPLPGLAEKCGFFLERGVYLPPLPDRDWEFTPAKEAGDTVIAGDGLKYVWTGFIITVIPILVIGLIARMRFKLNYFTIMGLIAGSTTDPPALAFANQASNSDAPAVGYSTVYPLTMFLRILTAQLIVLLLCSV